MDGGKLPCAIPILKYLFASGGEGLTKTTTSPV